MTRREERQWLHIYPASGPGSRHTALPELPDPVHERQCAAVLPIIVAAVVAALMVVALIWLPGLP